MFRPLILACTLLSLSAFGQTSPTFQHYSARPRLVLPPAPVKLEGNVKQALDKWRAQFRLSKAVTMPPALAHPGSATQTMRIIAGQIADPVGHTPLQTQLAAPGGVVVDKSGNSYVSDASVSVILKVTPAGVVSIVAGTGSAGYSGDNGPATKANIGYVAALALDGAGNLYYCDNTFTVVRKINLSTGIISLFAGTPGSSGFSGDGGPAVQAQLGYPFGLAVDSSNNVYIADTTNFSIREVVAATGVIGTVAGSVDGYGCTNETDGFGDGCAATHAFFYPYSVAINSSTMYISDAFDTVRAVDLASGIITAYAGSIEDAGFGGDGGPAISAELEAPGDVIADTLGNIYFVDGQRIREVNSSQIINTVVGGLSNGFQGDGGPATSALLNLASVISQISLAGNSTLLIGDTNNNRIREVTGLGGAATIKTVMGNGYANYYGNGGAATSAGLASPGVAAEDAQGNLYIPDYYNYSVRKVNAVTGVITTIAGTGLFPYAAVVSGQPATTQAIAPDALAFDANGNLYMSANGTFEEINAAGDISAVDLAAATGAEGAIALDGLGNIYYATGNQVDELTLSTGAVTIIANTSNDAGYSGDGALAIDAELDEPEGVALDKNGNLFVADSFNYRVREINLSNGYISTVAGDGTAGDAGDGKAATIAEIGYTFSVATDNAGDILVPDPGHGVVREVNATRGTIQTIIGAGADGFNGGGLTPTATQLAPFSVFEDSLGNLIVSDTGSNLIWLDTTKPAKIVAAVSSSATSVVVGGSVTLTVNFNGPIFGLLPTGNVSFVANGVTFATVALQGGVATFTASSAGVAPGTYAVTAKYAGDSNYTPATSAAIQVTVMKAASSAVLTATPNPVTSGSSITLTATVTSSTGSGAIPGGTVTFMTGDINVATVTLNSSGVGKLTASTAGYAKGTYPVIASYSGSAGYKAATSNTVNVIIQ